MLGIKNSAIQKEAGKSFHLCYFSYFSYPVEHVLPIFNISENIMRLVLPVLNIMKEMVTMPPCVFTVSSSGSSCFDLLEATEFLQSQKGWIKIKSISP